MVRESASTPEAYVVVVKEGKEVKEYKTKFSRGIYVFTAAGFNSTQFQTMGALVESIPSAKQAAKGLCEGITRRASLRVQSEDSRLADEAHRSKVVNTVLPDYGIEDEPWYIGGITAAQASAILAEKGLVGDFVIAESREGYVAAVSA